MRRAGEYGPGANLAHSLLHRGRFSQFVRVIRNDLHMRMRGASMVNISIGQFH